MRLPVLLLLLLQLLPVLHLKLVKARQDHLDGDPTSSGAGWQQQEQQQEQAQLQEGPAVVLLLLLVLVQGAVLVEEAQPLLQGLLQVLAVLQWHLEVCWAPLLVLQLWKLQRMSSSSSSHSYE